MRKHLPKGLSEGFLLDEFKEMLKGKSMDEKVRKDKTNPEEIAKILNNFID